MDPIVIIGTGLAGYNLAKEIRKLDKFIELTLITADGGESYSKPMLSNALSKGKTPEQLVISSANKMADSLSAEVLTHTKVTAIEAQPKLIQTARGEHKFSNLALAIGASPIQTQFAGNASTDILSVNNLDDYKRFRTALDSAQHIGIIGAGLIGCEFANDLLSVGKKVTVIGSADFPLNRLLPDPVGEFVLNEFSNAGIQFSLGNKVNAVERDSNGFTIHLSSGSVLNVDLVVSAIGLQPKLQLAREAGLAVNKGITVNRLLQTSTPSVFAMGDCAEVNGLVLPFVLPLMHAARSLAKTLTGTPTSLHYPAMPVVIKTPAHPVVVSAPLEGESVHWDIAIDNLGARALCYDEQGSLRGFVLTGDKLSEKQALTKMAPAVLE